MNTFKKKSLYAAVASIGALGFAGAVQAVNVNPDGLGQVLIYPYYTVNSVGTTTPVAYNSLLSVVNSTASAKAVKVRFIEGKASREVLDFNLFLSGRDVWTAAVIPLGSGAGVFTTDKSCTVPTVPSTAATAQPFVNSAYLGDGGGDGIERTKEGYVEIIEMGVVTGTTALGVTHIAGVPTCKAIDDTTAAANTIAPSGGLFGGISLINVYAGVDVAANAVALDNFRLTGHYDLPGDIFPNLTQVNPPTAVVFSGTSATGTTNIVSATGFTTAVDAVSALFMVNQVYNEFVLDAATHSGTDWVLTMPTKRYYFNADGSVNNLFQRNFVTNSCDDIGLTLWDREEGTPTTPQGFSPPPPPGKVAGLCWEANVLTFNSSNILGSVNNISATTADSNGWARLTIGVPTTSDGATPHSLSAATVSRISIDPTTGVPTVAASSAGTFFGLPIIGFQAQSFTNGTLTAPTPTPNGTTSLVQANYAASFVHRYTRLVQ